MPRSRPNKRDYVTVQLQRMMGKKTKAPVLIPDDQLPSEPNASASAANDHSTNETKPFRTPSIPSATVAKQPDLWRKRDHNSGITNETDLSIIPSVGPPLPPKNENINRTQDITLPSIQIQMTDHQPQNPPKEQVQYNTSR